MADNSEPQANTNQAIQELISSLPKRKGWHTTGLAQYQNFWYQTKYLPAIISFQRNFIARDSDILLASRPKTGTTWLKSLAFSTLHRSQFCPSLSNTKHPLRSSNPHELVPFLDFMIYGKQSGEVPDLSGLADPRLFATHVPYDSMPESVHHSHCKVIYISRNPLDMVVSLWHFIAQMDADKKAGGVAHMEDFYDNLCNGTDGFGPFWDHFLGYWKASLEMPDKVLFLKYEDLKEHTVGNLKRIAAFMGMPFSEEEVTDGVVEEIAKMCSIGNLKEFDANKTGRCHPDFENTSYFRKGEVGDWVNYFTPSMADRIRSIIEEKLSPFGLTFRLN